MAARVTHGRDLGRRAVLCCPSCKALAKEPQSQHQDSWTVSNSTATCPVSLSSTPRTERTAVSSSQPMSSPESAQHRLNQGPKKTALSVAHLSAYLDVLDSHCPIDPCGFQRSEPLAQTSATAPTPQLQKYTVWSAACKCYTYLEWLLIPLFHTPKQHPPRLGTCRPSQ